MACVSLVENVNQLEHTERTLDEQLQFLGKSDVSKLATIQMATDSLEQWVLQIRMDVPICS